ncbi:MAG: cytochrome ubiquinol oxidase subunit I [Aigarchaeota archaeon]|nr:cytochrome ubiquinol oxidase subunit I [Aigarchaeota archaeon]MDW7986763.1 cytochrome ubiquinol oxidase subunit I [Nitrososphaerota archaeon]
MDVTLPILVLGLILLIHLTFVNINIGLGFYSLILRFISLRRSEVARTARKVFKFLVATEVVSGVYGTMITVVLAGLFPTLVNIAATILFIPLIISILGILIRLTSIVAYWYTWDRVNVKTHLSIGIVMAVSGLMIPGGFRYIFALINNPVGLKSLTPLLGDPIEALFNPVYPPLLLHTWIGALSIGFLTAAAGLSWTSRRSGEDLEWSRHASLLGSLMIIPQGIVGFWFWSTLSFHSRYLFNSINKSFLPVGESSIDMGHSFLGMVLLAIVILVMGVAYYYKPDKKVAYILPSLAIISLILGEIAHDVGRLPYMVIIGEKGIEASAFLNKLIIIDPILIGVGVASILIMTGVFLILLYHYLAKGFLQ